MKAVPFDKYEKGGSIHWREMTSRDPRCYNAYLVARYRWILKLSGKLEGKHVLDLGCGDGALSYLLAKEGAIVTGVDADKSGLRHARDMLTKRGATAIFIQAPVERLPFEDGSFDVVVNCEVIEHLDEPQKMLTEAARVLKRGGTFVLTTPHRLTEIPQDPHHVHEFYPEELKKHVAQYFQDTNIILTHHLLWRSLFGYSFNFVGGRPLGKWLINTLAIYGSFNPFMIDYRNRMRKFDAFATICVTARKT